MLSLMLSLSTAAALHGAPIADSASSAPVIDAATVTQASADIPRATRPDADATAPSLACPGMPRPSIARAITFAPLMDTTNQTDTATHTTKKRARAIEYSDWYARRLTIHRWASYTMIPLFVAQYIAGEHLWEDGDAAKTAKKYHPILAGAVGTLFAVNTVTGVWNLIESRHDPEGRTRRIIHATLMLVADAGFTATGILGPQAEKSPDKRSLHRKVALSSMGVSLVSFAIMMPPFRRD